MRVAGGFDFVKTFKGQLANRTRQFLVAAPIRDAAKSLDRCGVGYHALDRFHSGL